MTYRNDDPAWSAVSSNSFLLIPHTVIDLDEFTENHDRYLVSVFDEPARAAALWRERLKRNPYGDDGFVEIQHYGRELISGDLWDQVSGIWHSLVELISDFLNHGAAETSFPGQPTPMRLHRQRQTVLLTINTDTTVVDPDTFFPGILDEAERYFQWVVEHIGTQADDITAVRQVRDRLDIHR